MEGKMTWDTLFHKEQDIFRRLHGKLPNVLYVGNTERALFKKWNAKLSPTYAGVPVLFVCNKSYLRFHL